MTRAEKQKIGTLRNKLNRYANILEYYEQVKAENRYITIVDLHKDFIYPKYFISRVTFYKILATPVKRDLKKLNELLSK
ncbi:hypothetical protein [Tenacibaculum insulae]|uniref:hypothetical protein n=1 Tax=Tenacibaculum insulae TaxID=2029677 RepID=UPI003AB1DD1B